MLLTGVENPWASTLVRGIMLALGYPIAERSRQQRVSLDMFTNAVNKLVRTRPMVHGQPIDVSTAFVKHMYTVLKLEDHLDDVHVIHYKDEAHCTTHIDWVLVVPWSGELLKFDFRPGAPGFCELEVFTKDVSLQLGIMMNWMCLQPRLRDHDIAIEGNTLSVGMWTAAKLYEASSDIAGKLATVDEALDRRY